MMILPPLLLPLLAAATATMAAESSPFTTFLLSSLLLPQRQSSLLTPPSSFSPFAVVPSKCADGDNNGIDDDGNGGCLDRRRRIRASAAASAVAFVAVVGGSAADSSTGNRRPQLRLLQRPRCDSRRLLRRQGRAMGGRPTCWAESASRRGRGIEAPPRCANRLLTTLEMMGEERQPRRLACTTPSRPKSRRRTADDRLSFFSLKATTTTMTDGAEEEGAIASTERTVSGATLSFNHDLQKLSRKKKPGGFDTAQRVEDMLLHAVHRALEDDGAAATAAGTAEGGDGGGMGGVRPNAISSTHAIQCWGRAASATLVQSGIPSSVKCALRAEKLLNDTLDLHDERNYADAKPNAFVFNAAMNAWASTNSRIGAVRAEMLLRRMWNLYHHSSVAVIGDDGETTPRKDEDLRPNARSYHAVINAVSRSKSPGCADDAAALLSEMEDLHSHYGGTLYLPDAVTFGTIINAYANSMERGSCDKALNLLQHMESLYQLGYDDVRPNTFVYNSCLNAFAKGGDDGADGGADDGSEDDDGGRRRGGSDGNSLDQDGALGGDNGNGNSNADKAEALLTLMERMSSSSTDALVRPDAISYGTVINAHANSNSIHAGRKAQSIARRMERRYLSGDDGCRPNAVAFTAVIKAWSKSSSLASAASSSSAERRKATADVAVIEEAATQSVDMLERMCLGCLGGDAKMKPTHTTFELVTEVVRRRLELLKMTDRSMEDDGGGMTTAGDDDHDHDNNEINENEEEEEEEGTTALEWVKVLRGRMEDYWNRRSASSGGGQKKKKETAKRKKSGTNQGQKASWSSRRSSR